MPKKKRVELFLDSGAFSAFTQKTSVDLKAYIAFIKEHIDLLTVYANLDVIGDPEATERNQKTMEKAGLHPLPCFHYGEPIEYLYKLLKKYDYIALGGMAAGISTKDRSDWLDVLFSKHLCDGQGVPRVKVHGYGMTSLPLMFRYPWYSVDSTSWVISSRTGFIYTPRQTKGEWNYLSQPRKVGISNRSPKIDDAGDHFTTMPKGLQEEILGYLKEKGLPLGKSEIREVKESYEPKEKEKWLVKPGKDEVPMIEKILTPGLCNHYRFRDEANVIYFLDLEKNFRPWPWPFKVKTTGLGI
jgi:hypothetical protein